MATSLPARALGGLRRKRICLGVDVGAAFVRACVWSGSKRRPELLRLGATGEDELAGPGTDFLGGAGPREQEDGAAADAREAFVAACARVFERVVAAACTHYGRRDAETVDFCTVVVSCGAATCETRLAVQEAARRVHRFAVTHFVSGPLAAGVGEHVYTMLQSAPLPRHKGATRTHLVVDIGATSAKVGAVRVNGDGLRFELLASADAPELASEVLARIGRESGCRDCFSLARRVHANPQDPDLKEELARFAALAEPYMADLARVVSLVVSRASSSGSAMDRLVLLGGGVQAPGLFQTIRGCLSSEGEATIPVFNPRWTPSSYLVAMGAAVFAGSKRTDKNCAFDLVDASGCAYVLGVVREGEGGGAREHHEVVAAKDQALPIETSREILNAVPGRAVLAIELFEESGSPLAQPRLSLVARAVLGPPNGSSAAVAAVASPTTAASGSIFATDSMLVSSSTAGPKQPAGRLEVSVSLRSEGSPQVSLVVSSKGGTAGAQAILASSTERDFSEQRRREEFQLRRQSEHHARLDPRLVRTVSEADRKVVHTISTAILHIVGAKDLARADKWGLSDPYCVVSFNGERVGQTGVEKRTLTPAWDQKFYLSFPGHVFGPTDVLHVDVFDHDHFSSDDFLGRAEVASEVIGAHEEERWYPLRAREDLPARKQKFVGGSLGLRFLRHDFPMTGSMVGFQLAQASKELARERQRRQDTKLAAASEQSLPAAAPPPQQPQPRLSRRRIGLVVGERRRRSDRASAGGPAAARPMLEELCHGAIQPSLAVAIPGAGAADGGGGGGSTPGSPASSKPPPSPNSSMTTLAAEEEYDEGDEDSASDEEIDLGKMDLRARWRVISGNVPIHGCTIPESVRKEQEGRKEGKGA